MFNRGDVICYERGDGQIRYGIFTYLAGDACFAHWGWTIEDAMSQSVRYRDDYTSWVLLSKVSLHKSKHTPATRLFLD